MFRLLCTFLSVGCCFTLFRQAHTAAVTDPNEVKVIESLAEKWDLGTFGGSITNGNPCTGRATDSTNLDNQAINLGIKCDCSFDNGKTCHVVRMKVKAKDITGEIPEELANLTYLQNLDLSQNYFTGPIPTSFGNVTSMQYLSVAANNLSGPVPKELGNLHNLISLSISENSLKGTLPPKLGSLTALEQLYIHSAGLSGVIPSTFRKLQKLKILWASDNQFTGGIPDFIGTWKNLSDLMLQGNAFQGPIPSSFSNLTSLTYLRVSDIMSGGSSLSFLKSMKQLTILVLRNNMISGELPSYIGELTGLRILDLSFNNFSGGIPYSLQSLNNLEFLWLGNNNLSGKLPSQRSASLAYIDLSYNWFSGALPPWFTDNTLTVNLVGNYFSTNETDIGFPGRGLGCLQRNFPCNKGAPQYYSFAINCGGPEKTSSTGTVYEQDIETLKTTSFYVSNAQKWGVSNTGPFMDSNDLTNIATSQSQIALTLDLQLYRTARLSPSSLRYYGLGLQNGPYTVTLQFAEIQFGETNSRENLGRRIFDVYIQGQKVLADFNIAKVAGSPNKAVVRYFNNTHVTSNFLEIHFFWAGKGTSHIPVQGTYGPLVSAISVTPEFNPTISKKSKAGMSKKSKAGMEIGITIGIATALICIILVLLLWRRRVQKLAATDVEEDNAAINVIRSKLKIFSYADMKTATGNFHIENKLGEGGYGAVYKGTLSDGEMVAVKQLSSESKQGRCEFINEVAVISTVQHRNLVKLHGCCLETNNQLLVYEYLENNSLSKALLGSEKSHIRLDWPTRYNICIGIARGLAYLHEDSSTRIIHRDIKASNILLDDSLNPKISDFGLAKLYDDKKTHVSTRVAGTFGYLSPEYAMRGHLTEKADVFSFGVLALEVVSGRSITDTSLPENMVYLLEWTWHLYEQGRPLELMDPDIESTCSKEAVVRVIEVALLCTQDVPTMRPSMSRAVAMLTSDVKVIPAASRPGYINDLQYINAISGATGTGNIPVVAKIPMQKTTQDSPIPSQDSLTLSSAENVTPSKVDSAVREG